MAMSVQGLLGHEALEGLARPVSEAKGLPPAAYISGDFAALERERLFSRTWMCAGFARDIPRPGDVWPVNIAGAPILLLRDEEGQVRAFYNSCRHRGTALLTEACHGLRTLTCPYHGWTYDLTGGLRATPDFGGNDIGFEGSAFSQQALGLRPVRLFCWHDWVFVNLDGEAPPFEEYARDLIEYCEGYDFSEFEVGGIAEFEFHANWKIVAENLLETYHTRRVHPALTERLRAVYEGSRTANDATRTKFRRGSFFASYNDVAPSDLRAWGLPAAAEVPDRWRRRHGYLHLFPNLILFIEPHNLCSIVEQPVAADHTRQRWHFCFVGEGATASHHAQSRARLIDFWTQVNNEDIAICEKVQLGRSSPAMDGGVFSPYWEGESLEFQQLVVDSLR